MTYSEAVEIMRYAQKKGVKFVKLSTAMRLSQFAFPMEIKMKIIDKETEKDSVFGLGWFIGPFHLAESDYHKGMPPIRGEMMRVSDILGIKE